MKPRQVTQKTVYIAMSGGVDSSVAALLLKRKGFRVVGVFMKPWQPKGLRCMWQTDRQDALQVAAKLDIPLLTWDFSKQYEKHVARNMINGYRNGITPNPDVLCNKEIKFGLFYDRAIREGADFVATGHYARIIRHLGVASMSTARDSNKDQTYFLWAIRRTCLAKTLFPLGNLLKSEVRQIAHAAHLATAAKPDSQGVCFVGALDVKSFLTRSIRQRQGKILHVDGREIGSHDGAAYYTIGQRHGLDIQDGHGPYFVVDKNIRKNTITVGAESDLLALQARIYSPNWLHTRPKIGAKVKIKIRYRTPAQTAVIHTGGHIRFARPIKAITPGQSAVIYQGNRVLGGGIIA